MRFRYLPLLVLALAACRADADQKTVSTSAALPFLPFPPEAEVVSRAGTSDAVKITFRSKQSPTDVIAYYRYLLPRNGWTLESDTQDAVGALALYAQKNGHPMWIRVSQSPGTPWTIVEISGAVVVPPTPPQADSAPPS
jgi:hypothetical protein